MVLSHLFPITQWLVIPTINSISGFFEKHCFSLSRVSSNSGLSGNFFNQFMEFKTKLVITDYLQSMQLTKTAENLQPACSTAVFAFPSFVLSCSKTTKKININCKLFFGPQVSAYYYSLRQHLKRVFIDSESNADNPSSCFL